jgi:hypothetical protein
MPLVILHHFLNVSVQLANKRGFKKTIAFQLLPRKHCCLRIQYLVTGVISLLILRSLPSNVYTCHNIYLDSHNFFNHIFICNLYLYIQQIVCNVYSDM